jgi:hypothetical protein
VGEVVKRSNELPATQVDLVPPFAFVSQASKVVSTTRVARWFFWVPDGIFSKQKSKFGSFLEGLAMLVYLMDTTSILQPFGMLYICTFGIFFGVFSPVSVCCDKKMQLHISI